jgi:Protein of unknown function (DUF1559)
VKDVYVITVATKGVASAGIHADRVARGNLHHRRADRAIAAGRSGRPRGRPAHPMHQQSQTARPGGSQLPGPELGHPSRDAIPGYGYPYDFSVFERILPGLEQAPLYNGINFSLTSWNGENATVFSTQIAVLTCPSDGTPPVPIQTANADGNYFPGINSNPYY